MWSDRGGPWLEEACGKLGRQEPSSRAELAADEGLSTVLCITDWSTTKTFKAFAFLPEPRAELWLSLGEASVRRGIQAPDLHPEAIFPGSFLPHSAPSLRPGAGSGPSRQVFMAV